MGANRREINRKEVMGLIKENFLSLYAQGGIDRISIGELCAACQISRSTFYYYFDDKYNVLEAVENELLDALRAISYDLSDCDMNEVLTGKPLGKASAIVRFLKENATAFRALLGKHGDTHFSYRWKKDIMDSFIDRFRTEKGDTPGAGIACTIFSSSLIGLYTHLLFDMPDVTEHEFSIIMGNLLKYSLFDFQAFVG